MRVAPIAAGTLAIAAALTGCSLTPPPMPSFTPPPPVVGDFAVVDATDAFAAMPAGEGEEWYGGSAVTVAGNSTQGTGWIITDPDVCAPFVNLEMLQFTSDVATKSPDEIVSAGRRDPKGPGDDDIWFVSAHARVLSDVGEARDEVFDAIDEAAPECGDFTVGDEDGDVVYTPYSELALHELEIPGADEAVAVTYTYPEDGTFGSTGKQARVWALVDNVVVTMGAGENEVWGADYDFLGEVTQVATDLVARLEAARLARASE